MPKGKQRPRSSAERREYEDQTQRRQRLDRANKANKKYRKKPRVKEMNRIRQQSMRKYPVKGQSCVHCGRPATELDHQSRDPDDVEAVCRPCHERRHRGLNSDPARRMDYKKRMRRRKENTVKRGF